MIAGLSALVLVACEPSAPRIEQDQANDIEAVKETAWVQYSEQREALGLPSAAPETRAEWQRVCENAPKASSHVEQSCENIEATGYPFPRHQVDEMCMYEDKNYGMKAPADPYFIEKRRAALLLWQPYSPDLIFQDVCEAYQKNTGWNINAK
ncbi:hypothetical protein BA950_07585 [Erythrobacter sp. SAORIC-644]|uniref:hypothetical protein n=1 Tax=Erythrobacter sp. SAORIC-644 TaxID=1869314 RepID=UPI000C9EE050|nr:hypothetical protein [Erythrobacter sp. SAORIC-644]PNQ76334.1 hypothetical protein BA950_07585 [Erythrobacter sp. SAORIC-644]